MKYLYTYLQQQRKIIKREVIAEDSEYVWLVQYTTDDEDMYRARVSVGVKHWTHNTDLDKLIAFIREAEYKRLNKRHQDYMEQVKRMASFDEWVDQQRKELE